MEEEGSGGWGIQWSTLQGLASSVLGSDVLTGSGFDAPAAAAPSESLKRRRRPVDAGADGRRSNSSGSWMGSIGSAAGGDAATAVAGQHNSVGRGDVRARGRRRPGAADQQQSSANGSPSPSATGTRRDSRRKYKRAISPDPSEDPAPPMPVGESDALAYVHHVKPTDTMEGVAIMYNIYSSSLRRANGMWPNDSIQRRKTLLLPVEDCGVKGKPFEPANSSDKPDRQEPEPSSGEDPEEEERGYRHESYVIIDGIGQVEIARLARKKLSHFPPRRRKESVSSPGLFGSPPPDESSVFKSMTPGVGLLGHGGERVGAGLQSEEPFTKALLDIAQGTTAGLENVGGAIEGFVRKWTAKAQDFAGHDLIELTQRLGFELEEDRTQTCTDGRDREAQRGRGNGESGSTARGDRGSVRERLPRTRKEREGP